MQKKRPNYPILPYCTSIYHLICKKVNNILTIS